MIAPKDCVWVGRELSDYLGDGLDAADRRTIETHIVICPPCRANLAQMRATRRAAAHVELEGLSPDAVIALTRTFRSWARAREET